MEMKRRLFRNIGRGVLACPILMVNFTSEQINSIFSIISVLGFVEKDLGQKVIDDGEMPSGLQTCLW